MCFLTSTFQTKTTNSVEKSIKLTEIKTNCIPKSFHFFAKQICFQEIAKHFLKCWGISQIEQITVKKITKLKQLIGVIGRQARSGIFDLQSKSFDVIF